MDAFTHRMKVGRRFGSRIAADDAVFQTGLDGIEALPFTVSDGESRTLSGANLFVLLQVMKDRGWTDPRFFTPGQARDAGWLIAPDASSIRLQYLIATGDDGFPLEKPVSRTFMVFNASEIAGVPVLKIERTVDVADLEVAALKAGFGENASGVQDWIYSLQQMNSVADMRPADIVLRARLAECLLSAQTGFRVGGVAEKASDLNSAWADEIDSDPLSFFGAARDAERVAATVLSAGRLVAQVRRVDDLRADVAAPPASPVLLDGGVMARKDGGDARLARLFEEREAVLAVPFADKDRAAALGAVWYRPQKFWFVPKGLDVGLFKEWNPRSHVLGAVATRETLIDSFGDAMWDLGLDIPEKIEADGQWHNVRVSANKGKNLSGSYILSLAGGKDGEPIGMIMNKFSGESSPWKHDGPLLTPEEKARMRAEILEREAKAEREAAKARDVAASHAIEIWALSREVADEGYVSRKGIDGDGLREVAGEVLLRYPEFIGESGKSAIRAHEVYTVVPLSTEAGELRAVQAISRDGVVKSFMRGAQKKGLMCVLGATSFNALGETDAKFVGFVEGVATGASLRAGSGAPVVVCFDADNLESVVGAVASRLPAGVRALIGADNDQFYVERAAGLLADALGLNPRGVEGGVVKVASGVGEVRTVALGEAIADGEWHDSPKGRYSVSLNYEIGGDMVQSVTVEIVPTDGRKSRSIFKNRGLEAGCRALSAVENAGVPGVLAVPVFASLAGRPTDWNDLHRREGVGMVKEKLGAVGVDVKVERDYGAGRGSERVGMGR